MCGNPRHATIGSPVRFLIEKPVFFGAYFAAAAVNYLLTDWNAKERVVKPMN